MKEKILIGTTNPHKQKRLKKITNGLFRPVILHLPKIREIGESFQSIAEYKAKKYSLWFHGWAIATDSGARIPALKDWNPLKIHRFSSGNDFQRMDRLIKMMKSKKNRTVHWDEALAVAYNGKIIFSTLASAVPAQLQKTYDKEKYEKGHWLDSLCAFPQFNKKNYFDLTPKQKTRVENSWGKLDKKFIKHFRKTRTLS